MRPNVIVIGGGISGLTSAWRLRQSGWDVRLLESRSELGGVMRSQRRDGFLLESGPFNVIVRDPAFAHLLEELPELEPVQAATGLARARYLLHRGRLWKVPSSPGHWLRSGLLSGPGKCRLFAGLLCSRRGRVRAGETVDQAACRRLGAEAAGRLVSALCRGIFAADSDRLGWPACFPRLAQIDRITSSPLGWMFRALVLPRRGPMRPPSGLINFRGGMGALPDALGQRLGTSILTGCQATSISAAGGGYRVVYRDRSGQACSLEARQLLLAVPHTVAASLVGGLDACLAGMLRQITASSLVVINLGFARGAVSHPLAGYGFLVPKGEPFSLLGVLWASSVFAHHAPPDHCLLRAFMGGLSAGAIMSRPDTELVQMTLDALRPLLGLTADPILTDVCRWPEAIPLYSPGHAERIAALRRALGRVPGLHLAGSYLDGVAVNDCVAGAARTAIQITAAAAKPRQPAR